MSCQFVLTTLLLTCGLVSSTAGQQELSAISDDVCRLRVFHAHTREHLDIVYRNGEGYDQDAYVRLNRYLRDYRTGTIHKYDPRVFDLLHDLAAALGNPDLEVDVLCGYRTPWSNEFLRTHGQGVTRHSLHMQAMAIDIRVPGVPTARVRDAAYYPASDFVHVDVGRVRSW